VPVVDLVVVASGFVLRALAGAAAVDVPVSSWFFIVASLGSLFMVAGKRESELRNLAAIGTRSTLEVYSHSYLSYVRAMSSGAVIVAYCLWALEAEGTTRVLFTLSIVPFAMGILRYALLVDAGSGESPEELVLHDRSLQVFGALLALLIGLGIYAT
jgi:decaprenyl-phosphate phosphoribosyltransferase